MAIPMQLVGWEAVANHRVRLKKRSVFSPSAGTGGTGDAPRAGSEPLL